MEVRNIASDHKYNLCSRIDRAFALLMTLQVTFASTLPAITTYAVIVGGIITILPIYFVIFKPGTSLSLYVNAVAQMCFASLLMYVLAGKPETHFLVFGSLTFLGLYLFMIYICTQASLEMKQIAVANRELMQTKLEVENIHFRRTQFFSLVSHELRTPLNGIINFTDFLREPTTPEVHREYIGIIKQCSDSLLRLVNDLLDFSKIDSGHLEIDPHPFKIQDIQEYLQNVFLFECQKKKLSFFVDVGEDVPAELVGDSHRIRQVLVNIVSNAVKFTDSGSIRVRLNRVAGETDLYRWDIEDTGIGIKKDSLNKLFSPYTQEFSSTARKYGGSGLGLAISRKLVELMGGKMDVESTLGKGSLFFFTLPLK